MKGIKEAMTLHHHPHSPLQKNLWYTSIESFLLTFFNACPYRHPFWRDSLSCADLISIVTTTILHPIGGTTAATITLHLIGCIIVSYSKGSWSLGVHSRRWCNFNIGAVILAHLLLFLEVTEDDDIVITRRS
jgi:hypothetical protein